MFFKYWSLGLGVLQLSLDGTGGFLILGGSRAASNLVNLSCQPVGLCVSRLKFVLG